MRITVAICTWNRSALLAQTLTRMTALQVPGGATWELLVVDNNSTDDTAAVVAPFEGKLPVRRIFETTAGLSNARNRATREASGDYILWTDDDVLVEPSWLSAYADAFARRPSAGFFGGVVRPWFASDPPEWLRRGFAHVATAYAARDHGPAEVPLTSQRLPFGANMAVRTAEQRSFPYDPMLGKRPDSALVGEETDVFRRMLAKGVEGWWVPGAVARHHIPSERMSVAYVRRFYMGVGEFQVATQSLATGPRLFHKPRWMWRSVIEMEARYRFGRVFRRPERWVASLRDASVAWGQLLHS